LSSFNGAGHAGAFEDYPIARDGDGTIQELEGKAYQSMAVVNGRTLALDCIGTLSAIFYGMKIDVTKDFSRYSGNGVSCLYQSLKARDALALGSGISKAKNSPHWLSGDLWNCFGDVLREKSYYVVANRAGTEDSGPRPFPVAASGLESAK
jgi:hypothetical protein